MTRPKNRALPPKKEGDEKDDEVIIPEVVEQSHFVTPQTIQILIKEDKQGDIQDLINMELDYNKKRLEIIREHAVLHPDAIERRKGKDFNRTSYFILILISIGLLIAAPFVNIAVGATFGVIIILIICGVLLNAREREMDLKGMLQLFEAILRRKQ